MGSYTESQTFSTLKEFYYDEELFVSKLINMVKEQLPTRNFGQNNNVNETAVNEFFDRVKIIILDMYNDYIKRKEINNKDISSIIEFIDCGRTNLAFKIGDNAIRLGRSSKGLSRDNGEDIDEIISPIYHMENKVIGENNVYSIIVSPLFNTNNLTIEDAYITYKRLRDLGYIWNDPKPENIGRIIDRHECNILGQTFTIPEYFKPGDTVVIDIGDTAYVGKEISDTIMTEIMFDSDNPNVYRFETRYEDENSENVDYNLK